MKNWNMTITGVDCPSNKSVDADVLFRMFLNNLKDGGHEITHALFTCGQADAATPPAVAMSAPPAIGDSFGGGFFAGEMTVAGQLYALVVAPKADGEKMELEYRSSGSGPDGSSSDYDGLANSETLDNSNYPAAQFCRSLKIGGFDDWYLPSRDELAMICRNLGPNRDTTPDLFKSGNSEAFKDAWYWSSTENASYSNYAWIVGFYDGGQGFNNKFTINGVRAVRRIKL